MKVDIKIPSVGESVQEAILAQWFKKNGDRVEIDEPLFLIETDKVTLEVSAETAGILNITVAEGAAIAIGSVVGHIDTDAQAQPAASVKTASQTKATKTPAPTRPSEPPTPTPAPARPSEPPTPTPAPADRESATILSPAVRRLAAEKQIDINAVRGSGPGGRVTKGDLLLFLEQQEARPADRAAPSLPGSNAPSSAPVSPKQAIFGDITRKPMSPIRRRIGERLLAARQNTAMLTTFNEIDMRAVMALRKRHKDDFKNRYGVSLGFMSFFIKATVAALTEFPDINAAIDGSDIVYHHYYHIGVAIGSERGLVVPVIRDADRLDFAGLEKSIVDFVFKVSENRLDLSDLEGGTFTITNGGVYGSLLSTPILNMPQSGILGMHKIEKRPIALDDKVTIRPMMYVALSYDHRIVDGKGAVGFLRRIKEWIENPEDPLRET